MEFFPPACRVALLINRKEARAYKYLENSEMDIIVWIVG
jgi:hypothetical protein